MAFSSRQEITSASLETAVRAARRTQMKPSPKKPGATKRSRNTLTPSQRRQNTTKLLVLALAAGTRKAGTKRPNTARPPVGPVARIKGNSVRGGSGALYCELIGDMADKAVDEMEQAIMQDDDAALDKAIADFNAASDEGHRHGCYFTYV